MLRYKACRNSIVMLELLNDSVTNEKRNNVIDADHAKFRCDRAMVINITEVETGETMKKDLSIWDRSFDYMVGKIVKTNFNETLEEVCTNGIHYFKTKEAALSWFYRKNPIIFPDGKSTWWYEDGQKDSEGTYNNGHRDGKWIFWYDNGNKQSEETYKDGKIDGKCIGWHDNGQKQFEGTYKDEKKNGKWIHWYDNGNKQSELEYHKGNLMVEWVLTVMKVTEEEEDMLYEWCSERKGRKLVDFQLFPPMFVVLATDEEAVELKKAHKWICSAIEKRNYKEKRQGLKLQYTK